MSDMTNKENEMINEAVEETEVKEIEQSEEQEQPVKEKKQIDWKYYLKIGLTLLIISAVTATLLSFVNFLTKDKIAANELAVMEEAIGRIFGDCDKIRQMDVKVESPVVAVYEVYDGNIKMGYGIQVAPMGFKEKIGMIVGTDTMGKCVGVEITTISDTPGVGTRVQEKEFLGGFKGLDESSADGYDTISGATISSAAVKEGVKAALKLDIFKAGENVSDDIVDEDIENTEDMENTEDTDNTDEQPEAEDAEDAEAVDTDASV